jgi:hypothetical protein
MFEQILESEEIGDHVGAFSFGWMGLHETTCFRFQSHCVYLMILLHSYTSWLLKEIGWKYSSCSRPDGSGWAKRDVTLEGGSCVSLRVESTVCLLIRVFGVSNWEDTYIHR